MQKKSERHFCLLVLGAFKPFLAVCLVMREDVEHLDRAVKNRERGKGRDRGQDRTENTNKWSIHTGSP